MFEADYSTNYYRRPYPPIHVQQGHSSYVIFISEASVTARKAIIHIYNTITKTIASTPNTISSWINKPHIQYINKQRKLVMGLKNTLTIFVQAKNYGITSVTVNPEDVLDGTLS